MKWSGENEILNGIFLLESRFLYISCYIAKILIIFWTVYKYLRKIETLFKMLEKVNQGP